MFRTREGLVARFLFFCGALFFLIASQSAVASNTGLSQQTRPAAATDDDKSAPPYHEYKGVRLGMSADEARKKLGSPTDKDDKQDFFVFNDNESAQVFYDAEKKVYAVSVIYMGADRAPTAKSILGLDLETKPDGSVHRKIDYPKAGCWVSYSRTGGDSPLITVTMMKKL